MDKKVFRFSELIPEGFTIDINYPININHEEQTISIPFKKLNKSCFNMYIDKYFEQETFMEKWKSDLILKQFKSRQFNLIEFEIKIGVLKFITKELNIEWLDILRDIKTIKNVKYPESIKIINIIGKDFLKSIIND